MWHQTRLSSKCILSSCALLIFGAMIYTSYSPYSNVYDRLANENILIEQALQRIPICTSDDRFRQRVLLHTLQAWKNFAQENHIRYWIAYSSLLGYVHYHALLPHESNIDLFIMAQDTSELVQLSQLNFSSDYKLKVHPQWYLVEQIKRSYFQSEDIDFLAPNARFININEHLYLNIWPIYDYNPNETRIEKNSKAMLTAYDTNYKWKSSTKRMDISITRMRI
jgi:phosphorylcholine metabolism protein LicD